MMAASLPKAMTPPMPEGKMPSMKGSVWRWSTQKAWEKLGNQRLSRSKALYLPMSAR